MNLNNEYSSIICILNQIFLKLKDFVYKHCGSFSSTDSSVSILVCVEYYLCLVCLQGQSIAIYFSFFRIPVSLQRELVKLTHEKNENSHVLRENYEYIKIKEVLGFLQSQKIFILISLTRSLKHQNKIAQEELRIEKKEYWKKDDHVGLDGI